MKKIVLASLLLASTVLMQAEVKFGVQAGINHNALSRKLDYPFKHQLGIGFYVGGQAEIFFNEKFSLSPELQYVMEMVSVGGTQTISGINVKATASITMSKIELPVMLKFYPVQRFSIEFGPRFSCTLGGTLNTRAQAGKEKLNESYNFTGADFAEMNTFNVGIGVGIGYRLLNGLGFNFRYNYNFIDRDKLDDSEGGSKVGGVQLGLSYQVLKGFGSKAE